MRKLNHVKASFMKVSRMNKDYLVRLVLIVHIVCFSSTCQIA